MNNSHRARLAVLIPPLLCLPFLVGGLAGSVRAQEFEAPASTTRGIQLYEQGDLQGATARAMGVTGTVRRMSNLSTTSISVERGTQFA